MRSEFYARAGFLFWGDVHKLWYKCRFDDNFWCDMRGVIQSRKRVDYFGFCFYSSNNFCAMEFQDIQGDNAICFWGDLKGIENSELRSLY